MEKEKPSRRQTFFRRLFSTVVLWAIVLTPVFFRNCIVADYIFLLLLSVLSTLGLIEFYDMLKKKGLRAFNKLAIAGGIIILVSSFFYIHDYLGGHALHSKANDFETNFLILFVLGLCVRQLVSKENADGLQRISLTLFGLMYVPWLLCFIQKINFFPGINGSIYVFYFILVTKFSDMGAYITGSIIGKHKMIPRISPGKTYEGLAGAILFSTMGSVIYLKLASSLMPEMSVVQSVVLGVILSLGAVVGDLIESLFKRETGIKDSGKFFPGIGGILDLMDSILFNAPIMYFFLRYVIM